MSNVTNTLTTKRFVIRKSLIGKNAVITFENKKTILNLLNSSKLNKYSLN